MNCRAKLKLEAYAKRVVKDKPAKMNETNSHTSTGSLHGTRPAGQQAEIPIFPDVEHIREAGIPRQSSDQPVI